MNHFLDIIMEKKKLSTHRHVPGPASTGKVLSQANTKKDSCLQTQAKVIQSKTRCSRNKKEKIQVNNLTQK